MTIPGWLAGLDGTISVGRLPSASVNASFSDIVKNLQGVFAGTVIAHNDTYIVGLDVFCTGVGDSITFKANGDGPFANLRSGSTASLDQDTTIATAFAGYRLPIGTPNSTSMERSARDTRTSAPPSASATHFRAG